MGLLGKSLMQVSPICNELPYLACPLSGLIRLNTYLKYWNLSSGITGNLKGEGTILGSTIVVGSGEQGILYEHRAREFGDLPDIDSVMDAVEMIE